MSDSEHNPALTDDKLEDLAHTLAHDDDFMDDVASRGMYEAIVEGDHGHAVDNESAFVLMEYLFSVMNDALAEYER